MNEPFSETTPIQTDSPLALAVAPGLDPATAILTLNRLRPTLVIGAGGTGQQIVTYLKGLLTRRLGPQAWQGRVRLLAFDTAEETVSARAETMEVQLEPNAEQFNIGNVPVPSIMQNIEGLDAIRERLGAILPTLPPVVLRSGAKQLRPFGLLSLLWNYKLVHDELRRAIWLLAGRQQHVTGNQEQGINIFICGSLVGGTGSGTFLDLAHLVRSLFTELGSQAEFCHITGVGILPQAFPGISGPNFLPNTAAALQELNHLMVKSGFKARYPDGRTIHSQEAPFNLFHIIDGVDERGQTWSDISAVCQMVAEGLYLQMGSQLGRKGENAFDNLDEALIGRTGQGDGTFLSSFGLGHLVFDAPAAARYCTTRLLQELMQTGWLRQDPDVPAEGTELLSLVPANIGERIALEPETGGQLQIDLFLPEWLLRKRPEEVSSEAARYVREYGQARLMERFLPQIQRNAAGLLAELQSSWEEWLASRVLAPDSGLPALGQHLRQAEENVTGRYNNCQQKATELTRRQERLVEAAQQLETGVAQAAASFPLGRAGRLRSALRAYIQAAQTQYESQLELQLLLAQQHLWSGLLTWLQKQREAVGRLQRRLETLEGRLRADLPDQLQALTRNGISYISVVDADYLEQLYRQHRPGSADVAGQLGPPLALLPLSTAALAERLGRSLAGHFQPVAERTIEQVLAEQSGQMTARARRQQLFRLATPSWNVNRARLPEGGAGLVRLEVLGVPEEENSAFAGEAMLVATHDPHRLTALVVTAGAPQSALQQYDRLQQCLEQERGRPFHILPDFMTSSEKAYLTFALSSIFNFIYNQGTFFYYRPADPLAAPIRLANGLANAMEAFLASDTLAASAAERVDSLIAHMGLSEAIRVLSDYCEQAPDGNTRSDEQTRELKRLVRDYVDDLRRINEFSSGLQRVNGSKAG